MINPSRTHPQKVPRAINAVGELDGAHSEAPRFNRSSNLISPSPLRNKVESAIPINVKSVSATKTARMPGKTAISSDNTR
jgi:hypothetical protein